MKNKLIFPIYELPWPEPFVPVYREVDLGSWRCKPTPESEETQIIIGYWRPNNYIPPGWMFEQKQSSKWLRWMSLTPMELESHMPHIAAAKGTVVVAGLGMGFYLYNILRKPEIDRVIVLEQDKHVVDLFQRSIITKQWKNLKKFELVMGDACEYKPEFEVDFLYADIWPYLGDKDALDITKNIQNNVKAKEVGFWGQEFDFCTWLMQKNKRIEKATTKDYNNFCEEENLPLIGRDNRAYPRLAAAAVILQTSAAAESTEQKLLLLMSAFETLKSADVLNNLRV